MAESEIVSGTAITAGYDICEWSDNQIEALLQAIGYAVTGNYPDNPSPYLDDYMGTGSGMININGQSIDPHDGAGTLLIDRLMSELSNLESISANAIATLQRIQKEMNSKLT